jgi:hypothetical protein
MSGLVSPPSTAEAAAGASSSPGAAPSADVAGNQASTALPNQATNPALLDFRASLNAEVTRLLDEELLRRASGTSAGSPGTAEAPAGKVEEPRLDPEPAQHEPTDKGQHQKEPTILTGAPEAKLTPPASGGEGPAAAQLGEGASGAVGTAVGTPSTGPPNRDAGAPAKAPAVGHAGHHRKSRSGKAAAPAEQRE